MDNQASITAKTDGEPFIIAGWLIDPASLRISKDNQTIKLEPKAMAVLDYLTCRPNTVVSRQELEDTIWAGTVVGYDSLGNSITKLRKALGDDARDPHIIETIAKSGYRLIAEVSFDNLAEPGIVGTAAPASPAMPTTQPVRRRWSVVSATVILFILAMGIGLWWQTWFPEIEPVSEDEMDYPLPDKPSIAVLPFTNISNDAEQEYFAVGMTVDLITDISQVSELFVIAYNSVKDYKGKSIKIRQIAKELGVRYVMEGSVRRVGNQVRTNVQLIDSIKGDHVWAERYDGSLDDVFSMQDKIAQKIVTALTVTLADQQGKIVHPETTIPEAYDAYLRGWERYRLGAPEDLGKAVSYFEQAIELDPKFTSAHSPLAAVYWNIAANGWWSKSLGFIALQAIEQSRVTLARAMKQPTALTHQVASERAAYYQGNPRKALAEAERAVALDNNDPAGHLAMANALLKAGRAAEAVESVHTAMRLDPHYPAFYLNRLGQAQFAMGEYGNAAKSLEKSAERNPDDDWTFVYLAATYGHLGYEQKAKNAIKKANVLRAKAGWGKLTAQNIRRKDDFFGVRNFVRWTGDYKQFHEGLRKAGVTTEANWYSLISGGGSETSSSEIKGATTIDAQTAKTMHERGVPFIDVNILWLQKRIPGAIFLDMIAGEFNDARLEAIVDKHQEVVIYSSRDQDDLRYTPRASAQAVTWGFEKIYHFRDGLAGWKAAGYPVETGN